MTAFVGARLFDGVQMLEGAALVVENGRVAAIVPHRDLPAGDTVDLDGGVLAPGFVDWQVNGGGGYLFNDAPTPETIRGIVAAHRRFGTTALAPTVITDAPDVLAAALAASRDAIPGSIGVHVEGPFIDPRRKGAHPERHIRPMTPEDSRALIEGGAKIVTLAPTSAPRERIAELAGAGVIVSLGHSDATAQEARACFDAGVRCVTHLYNAMSPLSHRAPGVVGAALDDHRVFVGLIADGLHSDPIAARLAYRVAGAGRITLISDAMPPAAGGPDVYTLNGREVRREGLRLTLPDGTLAGAAITMLEAVQFSVRKLGATLSEALQMATSTPARAMRVEAEHGALRPGARADLVHLGDDLELRGVWFGGERTDR